MRQLGPYEDVFLHFFGSVGNGSKLVKPDTDMLNSFYQGKNVHPLTNKPIFPIPGFAPFVESILFVRLARLCVTGVAIFIRSAVLEKTINHRCI